MSIATGTSSDKNIVDRTRVARDPAMAKAIRATRERLQFALPANPEFAREMLVLHVNAVLQNAAAMPFLIIAAVVINLYFDRSLQLVVWAAATLAAYALLFVLARRAAAASIDREQTARWARRFLLVHGVIGVCWALFAIHDCTACEPTAFAFYEGVILLIALAATAMTTFTLRRAILASFLPTVFALAFTAWVSQAPYDVGTAFVFAAAFGFFVFVSDRLHFSNLTLLSFQSEKVALIAELEVAKAVSDEARRRAEEANLAKSRFLASMSHELRTPLNAILGFSEVMSNEVLGPLANAAYKEYAADIHNSGEHLLNLINEILDLSRIEAGRYELTEDALSLAAVAEDCIGMVQLKARSKQIAITSQFEKNMPPVWADERGLRQVVLNLLSNAVKFTQSMGAITVKVGWTAGGGQYVSVRDNGPGIPEEEIPIVLSSFGQGSIAIKSAEQGTGLGLPIIQAILAKHGGQFILKSKLREGTEAVAILPLQRVLQSLPPVDGPAKGARRAKRRAFA